MNFLTQDAEPSQEMSELLDSVDAIKPIRRGDVVEGIVMRADSDGIFVNIGHKAEGVVPPGEMRTLKLEDLSIGDSIITLVVRGETGEDAAILSVDRAVGEQGWRYLEKVMEADATIEGTIMGFNRGGAIVEAEGVQGFVPMSQLVTISRARFRDTRQGEEAKPAPQEAAEATPAEATTAEGTAETATAEDTAEATTAEDTDEATTAEDTDEATTAEDTDEATTAEGTAETATAEDTAEATTAEDTDEAATAEASQQDQPEPAPEPPAEEPVDEDVGKVLTLKVLEVNRARNRAIFSERQALQELRDEQKARLIEELTVGETRHGKVTGISSFGAFVDLGGADGLVHISELSWDSVNKPEDVVQVGDELDVFVLRVDAENKKIALSLRRLQPEPWETINDRYQVGDIVEATVTKLTNFGAFARVEGSVEGLIHISELTSRIINHPREVVGEGDTIRLKILRIEPERRRLGLSLKEAQEEEEGF
jgi:ribosomal protein S1